MSSDSKIEWTESTWNPLTGCSKVSPGCQNCYAEVMARRLQANGNPNYRNGFKLTMHEHLLKVPLGWKKPRIVFVNSMSDLFHEDVSVEFIMKTLEVMRQANWHRFQILTKRAERLAELDRKIIWTPNIWMGVSVENQDYTFRIDCLRKTGACVKFVSFEPLLEPLPRLNLKGIDWVIVGGESGPRARPMSAEWVKDIRDQCLRASVPFFFKQWGGFNKKKNGRKLEGRTWDEMPSVVDGPLFAEI
ncbi:MAG: phage Gp37/Gp68 family protein [candidate division WOR-3 bacterium]|nr:phage Gp37/Gp68 family protein [candidate division WOR-3 bacterium]